MLRRRVEKARAREDYSEVKQVGVDETCLGEKGEYISLYVDLARNKLLFGTVGNTSGAVEEFAQDLALHKEKPEEITDDCCDMWRAYKKGVRENFPKAAITYDRCHFICKINKAVDEVRRSESRENKELKKKRMLFLKNPENLTPEEREALKPLCKETTKTGRAYALKVSLRQVYGCPDKKTALAFLEKWADWAQRSGLKPFQVLAKSVRANAGMIAQWHESHVSNGILEGLNSIVQAAKAKARGYRNPDNFICVSYLLAGKLQLALHTK